MITLKSLESGKTVDLSITDGNGCDYAVDCIGNAGGWDHIDYDNDQEIYTIKTDQDQKWWSDFCDREQAEGDAREAIRGLGVEPELDDIDFSELETYQEAFCQNIKDALEDGAVLKKYDIAQDEAERAHAEITEILERECFR